MKTPDTPPGPAPDRELTRREFAGLVAVPIAVFSILSFLALLPSVFGGFHFDDAQTIVENTFLLKEHALSQYSQQNWFRWRLYQSFKIDIDLMGGRIVPEFMHAVNLVNHIQVGIAWAVFVWWMLKRLERPVRERVFVTVTTSGLFLLHPLISEPAAYVTGRADLISALFLLLALLAWCRIFTIELDSRRGWLEAGALYLASMVLLVWAVFSKESAIIFPFLVGGVWLLAFQKAPSAWTKLKWGMGLPVLTGIGLIVARAIVFGTAGNPETTRPVDATLATNAYAVVHYLRLWLVPVGLNLDHDFPVVNGFFTVRFLVALAVVGGLLWFLWKIRKAEPVAAFGLFVFFAGLAPTTSIIPITDLLVERRMYVPCMGLALAASTGIFRLIDAARQSGKTARVKWIRRGLQLVMAAFTLLLLQRGIVWSSEVSLWQDAANGSPGKARPWRNLGTARLEAGDPALALVAFDKLFKIDPYNVQGFVNAAEALRQLNFYDDAWDILSKNVMTLDPKNISARFNMAQIAEQRGQPERAQEALEGILAINPGFVPAIVKLGTLAYADGEPLVARDHFERALELKDDEPTAHRYLTLIYSRDEPDFRKAKLHAERLSELLPDDAQARKEVALFAERTGDYARAFTIYRELAERNPRDTGALLALASLHGRQRETSQACAYAMRAARIDQTAAEDSLSYCLVPQAPAAGRSGSNPPG